MNGLLIKYVALVDKASSCEHSYVRPSLDLARDRWQALCCPHTMKTVVLHIGRQKTGTTALQSVLSENRAALSANGIWYPDAGRQNDAAHHLLASCLNPHLSTIDESKALRMTLRSEIETRPEPTIVISSESFQAIRDLSRVQTFFDPYRVVIVAYLREALAWKQSAWAQRIHAQCYADPFVLSATQHRVNYPEFYRRWASAYRETRFVLFERDRLIDGDVVSDFFTQIDHAIPMHDIRQLTRSQDNPSLGGNLLHFKRLMNLAHIGQSDFRSRYTAFSQLAKSDARWRQNWFVSEQDAGHIRRFDRESNDFLRQRFGELNESEPWNYPRMPDTDTLADDFSRILAHPQLNTAFEPLGLISAFH